MSFEDYKGEYRTQIRSAAKGKSFQVFETLDGKTYHDVIIREVNPIGILINHRDGSKRIAYANLPNDMQDLYQFDPDEKRKLEEAELLRKKKHLLANDAFQRAEKQGAEQNRVQEERAEEIRRQHAIASLDTRRNNLASQILSLEMDIRSESYKRISRAPIMREQLAKLREELKNLDSKILSLRSTN